jgi:pimeloyl-ACP methyl ester carboxylesterase
VQIRSVSVDGIAKAGRATVFISGALLRTSRPEASSRSQRAWRSRPVWALLGTADRCIDPGVHRFSYERMGAQVTELDGGSHVIMISHPKEVAAVVMTAARTCGAQPA